MQKAKKIDIKQIKESFKSVDDADVCALGLSLIAEIEFMKKTLTSLKKEINIKGVVTEMCQGKYNISRANPAITAYNAMVKNYNSTIKQVYDLLKPSQKEMSDDFDEFLEQ